MSMPRYKIGTARRDLWPLFRIDYDPQRRRRSIVLIDVFDSRSSAKRFADALADTAALAREADALTDAGAP
jgi:hypothetical protein